MKLNPPLNESIAFALSNMIDDAQTESRKPTHSDIQFSVLKFGLKAGDPKFQGVTAGKKKRIRSILLFALEHSYENGCGFVGQLIATIRTHGGFRPSSTNYAGEEAIISLRDAMASEGFLLTTDGELQPQALESLTETELTEALSSYVRRAQKGSEDAALVVGTGKDLLEAIAAHVLLVRWNNNKPPHSFPTLLGQAFEALGLKTTEHKKVDGEPPLHRLQRALFEAACALNTLRNKEGTGHGRPWLSTLSAEEARHATQVMGVVGNMLLRELKK